MLRLCFPGHVSLLSSYNSHGGVCVPPTLHAQRRNKSTEPKIKVDLDQNTGKDCVFIRHPPPSRTLETLLTLLLLCHFVHDFNIINYLFIFKIVSEICRCPTCCSDVSFVTTFKSRSKIWQFHQPSAISPQSGNSSYARHLYHLDQF